MKIHRAGRRDLFFLEATIVTGGRFLRPVSCLRRVSGPAHPRWRDSPVESVQLRWLAVHWRHAGSSALSAPADDDSCQPLRRGMELRGASNGGHRAFLAGCAVGLSVYPHCYNVADRRAGERDCSNLWRLSDRLPHSAACGVGGGRLATPCPAGHLQSIERRGWLVDTLVGS